MKKEVIAKLTKNFEGSTPEEDAKKLERQFNKEKGNLVDNIKALPKRFK